MMTNMSKMKHILKRAAAGALALAMCAGLTGCYSEDKAWAAKMGEDTMPIGGYIYYLSSAYSQGSALVENGQEVLKNTIEGQNASQCIQDKALEQLKSFYFVQQKFDEMGLALDEEDQENITNASNSMWSYYKTAFEAVGVAQSSFTRAYAEYNIKLQKVMQAMYGEGGERALTEDEMHDYYTENYIYYNYFYVPFSTTDEEGQSKTMEEDEQAQVKEALREHVKSISSGDETLEQASAAYVAEGSSKPTLGEASAINKNNLSEQFSEALTGLKDGESAMVDMSSGAYVLQKMNIETDYQALINDETRKEGLIAEMKGEEFTEYVKEQSASVNLDLNEKAIGSVKLSLVAETLGKNGTSSASSQEEESSSSESSSSESSEASSEESSEESSEA